MKVCIIGDGLVSLSLANILLKKELSVDILCNKKNKVYDKSRTLAISESNVNFFNNEIININKILWPINEIKIYTEKNFNNEILKFNNKNNQIFSILRNYELQKLLVNKLKKSKFVKFKKIISYNDIIKKGYQLIINCDAGHQITKKFFFKKLEKNYNSYAFTTVINHKKILNNKTAFQNFTENGPIAFLPISETQTSVVYSFSVKGKMNTNEIQNLIKKYNPIYSINKIEDLKYSKLKSSNLRKYYQQNILAFGDLLHRIHPLAGQGFNMSLRDIKVLSDLISEKIELGLELDYSICSDFQKKSKDKNYLFSLGIDWIYELFNFERKTNSKFLSKSINTVGKNKFMNSLFKKFANNGIKI